MPQEFNLVNDVDGATHVCTSQPRSCISSLLPLFNILLTIIMTVAVIVIFVRMDQRGSQQAEIETRIVELRDEIKIMRKQIKYFEAIHSRSLSGAQTENVTEKIKEVTTSNCSTLQPQSNFTIGDCPKVPVNHTSNQNSENFVTRDTPPDGATNNRTEKLVTEKIKEGTASNYSPSQSRVQEMAGPTTIHIPSPTVSISPGNPAPDIKTHQKKPSEVDTEQEILFEVVDCQDILVSSSLSTCGEIKNKHNLIYRVITGVRVNKQKKLTHVSCCNVTISLRQTPRRSV